MYYENSIFFQKNIHEIFLITKIKVKYNRDFCITWGVTFYIVFSQMKTTIFLYRWSVGVCEVNTIVRIDPKKSSKNKRIQCSLYLIQKEICIWNIHLSQHSRTKVLETVFVYRQMYWNTLNNTVAATNARERKITGK